MPRLLVLSALLTLAAACDPPGECAADTDCEDNDFCTQNVCDLKAKSCTYVPLADSAWDDGDACTTDFCHPTFGFQHDARDVSDGNACTEDVCDPATGEASHPPLAAIDDGDACTVDRCDTRDGAITRTAVPTDDRDACTNDACDPATGEITHAARPEIDDDDACTIDSCNPATGAIDHVGLAEIDDDDACTVDECLPETGEIRRVPLPEIDDADRCTADACDPATGEVTHTEASVDDEIACTVDRCDPATGDVTHVATDGLCSDEDGATCTVPRCLADGCAEVADAAACDDGIGCTTGDACDPANGTDATGCVRVVDSTLCVDDGVACTIESCDPAQGCVSTISDAVCELDWCHPSGCLPTPPDLTGAIFSEFQAFSAAGGNAGEWVELHNTGARDGAISGAYLSNALGELAPVRPVTDPAGALGEALLLRFGTFAVGVPNPLDPAEIPAHATFVYGEPGTSFALDELGDVLSLHRFDGTVVDAIDFLTPLPDGTPVVHSDEALAPVDGQFVLLAGASTQLDAARLTSSGNDSGNHWCLGLRASHSAGAANPSCGELVVNEVLYDFDHPVLGGVDEGRVFVELAGPGGAPVTGVRLVGVDGSDRTRFQRPDVTFGVPGPALGLVRLPLSGLVVIADGDVDGGTSRVPRANVVLGQGDPVNGDGNGDGLLLLDAAGEVLDAVAYGPAAFGVGEGAPAADLDPDRLGVSLARAGALDTGDNALDFHLDPSPTPGLVNDAIVPRLTSSGVLETHTGRTVPFTLRGRDVADYLALKTAEFAHPAGGDVTATLDGRTTPDTTSSTDGCTLVDAEEEGRGDVLFRCVLPTPAAPALAGLSVANPAGLALSSILTQVNVTRVANESDVAGQEAGRCVLSGIDGEAQTDFDSPVYSVVVSDGTPEHLEQPLFVAQLAWGRAGTDPRDGAGWRFRPLDVQAPGRASGTFSLSNPGDAPELFHVLARVSIDGGQSFTYCDTNGAGRDEGFDFSPALGYAFTVRPVPPPPPPPDPEP